MRAVVTGGSGPTGSSAGPEPSDWEANTVTREATDLWETPVVIDVTHSPALQATPLVEFFEISTAYFGDVEHSFRLMSNAPEQFCRRKA